MRKYLLIIGLALTEFVSISQTLPVGFTVMENYLRRAQLLGEFDSTYSLAIRPIRTDGNEISEHFSLSYPIFKITENQGIISLFPVEIRNEFNSHHPKYSNNGTMQPGRGLQSIVSFGSGLEFGPLKVYIRPEVYYSQNKSYDGFPENLANRIWSIRYRWWNKTDLPEQFGDSPKFRLLHGQSKASIDLANISIGVSTENLWWGPGRSNSLIMTNNARGFQHLSFNSIEPVSTPIGHLEWQLVAGRLEGSGRTPPFPDRFQNNTFFVPKNEDWRYLNGFSLIYSPKWVPNLFLGFNRAFQQYSEMAIQNKDYLPVFLNFFRQNDRINRQELNVDQVLSAFFRYFSSKSNAEFYFEYGRNDASLNIRDFIMSPEHSRAYVVGGTKLFTLKNDKMIEVNLEMTQLQQSVNNLVRPVESWYTHTRVSHGYTHRGEVIGASIGPGSNAQSIEINWTNNYKQIGIGFERLVHNNDFFLLAYSGSRDWRRYWVDLSPGANISWDFNNLLLQSRIYITRSLNYQWELQNNPDNVPYFVRGRDVTNLFISFKVAYFFDDLKFGK